jgi:branched-chain amino acid transport system substrate-binding protein
MRDTTPGTALRIAAVVTAAATLLALTACGDDDESASAGGGETTVGDEDLLGPINEAEGEPVKVGFISDGANASSDFAFQFNVADAVVAYLNEHQGGIGGRPIELVECETGLNDEAKATDCANELIQAGVVVTVLPESTATPVIHRSMDEAGIPIVVSSIANRDVVRDRDGTFVLANPFANQWALPIGAAEESGVEKVTAVVIDVPQAVEIYTSEAAQETFADADIELEVVRIPPAQADMTPQMAEIAAGDPTLVHIVGGEAFCISALNGLRAAAFDGPISVLNFCATDATRQAVGDYLEGAYIGSSTPVDDPDDPSFQQWQAIYDEYGSGIDESQMFLSLSTYLALMGMHAPLADLTGDITPATITDAIAAMPSMDLPGGGGVTYRCNGNAVPDFPAICTRGTLASALDADGEPTLPWTVVGDSEIED